MDLIIVGIIVAAALVFTVRSFVKIYKGDEKCGCGGCSCDAKDACDQEFPTITKK